MTTRDDDDELIALATGPGELQESLAARLEAASPEVRAEVASLRAVRALLDGDAAWGQSSGTDAPPPHLFDAILRAEVAARPDEIRQAVALAQTPPPAHKPLWARLSGFLLGGGVAVGAALALVVTMQRGDAEVAAPQKLAAAATEAKPAQPALVAPDPAAAPAPASPADTGTLGGLGDGIADAAGGAMGEKKANDNKGAVADDEADDLQAAKGKVESKLGEAAALAPPRSPAESKPSPKKADRAVAKDFVEPTPDAVPARPRDVDADSLAKDKAEGADGAVADRPQEREAAQNRAGSGSLSGAGPGMPAQEAPPAASAPTKPSPPPPRIVSAEEARRTFLARKEEAKESAKKSAMEQAKQEPSSKAKARPATKSSASRGDGAPAGIAQDASPDEVREQMARQQRLQEANSMLVAAERELTMRRFDSALDLALRAEAIAGSGLGLAPASTQVRAFVALRRPADATRAASRLVGGDVRDPQLREGMRAGVDAALSIGDFRLAERLLVRLASKDNDDATSRADAQARLESLRSKTSAPAKVREAYDSADSATDTRK